MSKDKPVNILYVVRTWAMGGGQTIVLSLLRNLDKKRFNIIVAPYDAPGTGDDTFAKAAEAEGATLANSRVPWQSRGDWGKARDAIAKLVDEHEIDLIHTHDPQSNVIVGMNRDHYKCACVASAYGWWRRLFPLRSHAYVMAEKFLALPKFNRVITVSQTMKGQILRGRTPADKIRVVHTGIDPKSVKCKSKKSSILTGLGIEPGSIVVGTVGRVFVEKGHKYLLAAANRLYLSHPDMHILIVGDGPLLPKLKEEVQVEGYNNRVTFTGFYDDLPAALKAMDIFVLPTILDEGFPTAVLEAQLAGLPVIATDTGGTHETMDVGNSGLLVKPRDVEGLAQAIAMLLNDGEKRHLLSSTGPDFVKENFTVDKMMAGISDAYDEALAAYSV